MVLCKHIRGFAVPFARTVNVTFPEEASIPPAVVKPLTVPISHVTEVPLNVPLSDAEIKS